MLAPHVKLVERNAVPEIRNALQRLERTDVLVGIPEEKSLRRNPEINNAQLMYIFTNGSPVRGIPKRGVIEPAIMYPSNKAMITDKLEAATGDILDGDLAGGRKNLNLAGQVATAAAKGWFFNPANNWPPNTPATIARKGSDQPGIDTAQMRRAITFIVEEG